MIKRSSTNEQDFNAQDQSEMDVASDIYLLLYLKRNVKKKNSWKCHWIYGKRDQGVVW